MKIDDKARKYFGDLETLEQLDGLWLTLDAYLKDLSERVLAHLEARLRKLSNKRRGWVVKRDKVARTRSVTLTHAATNKLHATEVGFWCEESEDWSCFNASWLGVKMNVGKQRRKEEYGILSSCFKTPKQDDENYVIYENFKEWPNLEDDDYVSLYRVTADEGKSIIDDLAGQIDRIIAVIETKTDNKR